MTTAASLRHPQRPHDPSCSALTANVKLRDVAGLQDPFAFFSSNTTVKNARDWSCRQNEISGLFQEYELGTKPPKPDSIKATLTSSSSTAATLSITVTHGGKNITFSPTISYPTSGQSPYPAVIGIGGVSIPKPQGVATINFDNNGMGAQLGQSSRGQGLFYTLYGSNATAGAMMAWAWGVSRIIDALEVTPSAGIDPKRLAVTGCSRNGKGAFIAGAFDERIALTLPQESGSGGSSCWRVSDYMKKGGINTQTASQIINENVWFSPNFNTFGKNGVLPLPVDHHLLPAITAPRGLFVIENSDYVWLGPESSYKCMQAGRAVYQALGVADNFGFSQIGGHGHCSFPSNTQGTQLDAFYQKFFFGKNTSTNIFETDQGYTAGNQTWVNWSIPNLVKGDGSAFSVSTALPTATAKPTATATATATPTPRPSGNDSDDDGEDNE